MSYYSTVRAKFGIPLLEPIRWDRHNPELCRELALRLRQRGRERYNNWNLWHNPRNPQRSSYSRVSTPIPLERALDYDNRYLRIDYDMSSAFRMLFNYLQRDITTGKGVFVDAGCGDSADVDVAMFLGWDQAIGIDLLPNSYDLGWKWGSRPEHRDERIKFIQADLCERVPMVRSGSVDAISSSAVIGLMTPPDAIEFYEEAHRLLKPGGLLSLYTALLVSGRLVNTAEEWAIVEEVGFQRVGSAPEAAVFVKEGS